jgi:hypothetical protein
VGVECRYVGCARARVHACVILLERSWMSGPIGINCMIQHEVLTDWIILYVEGICFPRATSGNTASIII